MNKPRILVIENSIDVTGSLTAVLRSSSVLKIHYDFVFVLPEKSRATSLIESYGFQIYELPMVELSRRWKSILIYLPSLMRCAYEIKNIVKHERISIVHVNDFYNMIMPFWRLCGGRIKYLSYINFIPDRFPGVLRKIWIRSHLLFSNKIIAVSQHVLKQLPIDEKVICIPDALPADEDLNQFSNDARRKVFLFIGNFIEGKGQDIAIRAFALVASRHPDWKLRLVGGDMGLKKNAQYKLSLKNLAKALAIENKIEWEDFSKNVQEEYKKAAVALNFSVSESFSLTVQEAMFYGCAIIATDCGGPSELIDNEYSGLLVPVNGISSMVLAMEDLLDHEDKRKTLALQACKSIREKFNKTKTTDLLNNVYKGIIN